MVLTVADARKLTVPRLKEELTKRGLDSTGNKPDLLSRLTESIEQAAEDLILSDAGGVADVHHLLSDDILNDDILDAPSIDGDLLGETVASPIEEQPKPVKEETEKKEVVLADKPVDIVSVEQGKRARAIRFGLPVTAESVSSDDAKAARAKRFDLPEDAKRLSSDDAKAKRAERFGLPSNDAPASTISKEEKDEKLAARAARFGLPVGAAAGSSKTAKDAKLAERAKRFGGNVDDAEAEAKKKARLERFGAGGK